MNEAGLVKTSENSPMDIVSMAFSNVSENSDLMEVVNAVSQPAVVDEHASATDSAPAPAPEDVDAVQQVHCVVENQPADVQIENGEEHPGQIEIPLPPNAIITVNDQGEQIIELAQVVDPDPTCPIEHIEQIEQVETVANHDGNQPGPAGDVVPISVGEDGLEAISFQHVQGQDVSIGDEACVVPVSISLTDVQNLQQVVTGAPVGPGGESAQVSSADVVATSSTPGLSANASSLFGSLATIIDSNSVLTTSSSSLAASGMPGATFVSGAGVPLQVVPSINNSVEIQNPILGTSASLVGSHTCDTPSSSSSTSARPSTTQFIHNGTNLPQINFNESVVKNQLINTTQTASSSARPVVVSTNQMGGLPPFAKSDPANAIGNRSVFSPMTLTIRTPPGAPAVNQALINSIVNNTEVQALLKRNPGQPITIVRVPEDPVERRLVPGVITAKVVTSSSASTGVLPRRPGPGRPRKEPNSTGSEGKVFVGRKRGRQPGTKLQRKDEEYLAPVSWHPVKSRTRSGRISRPPGYRTENFKTLYPVERSDSASLDAEGLSDIEADSSSRVSVTPGGRVKKFKCRSCSKAYIGRGGLARHFLVEPSHGNIDDYDLSEVATPKPRGLATDDVQHTPDELVDSEISKKETIEGRLEPSGLSKPNDVSSPALKEPVIDLDDEPAGDEAEGKPSRGLPSEPVQRGRRGRPPLSTKDDPDFKPGTSANKGNLKSKDKRKETMRQALKFLNHEDYVDVCLPRLARHLPLWDFLISKAEADKEGTPPVVKILEIFEELLSDVREMAINCLEKVDDADEDSGVFFLDEDDELARVLEFDKGWYKVSEPPAGAGDLPFSVASQLRRKTFEVIGNDEVIDVDEDEPPAKTRKLQSEHPDTGLKTPLKRVNQVKAMPKQAVVTDPKSITVHVHDGKVTTEQGSPSAASLRTAFRENNLPGNTDPEPQVSSPDSEHKKQPTNQSQATEKAPLPSPRTSSQTSNSVTHSDPEQQPLARMEPERQASPPLDPEQPPVIPVAPALEPENPSAVAPLQSSVQEEAMDLQETVQPSTSSQSQASAVAAPLDPDIQPPQGVPGAGDGAGTEPVSWADEGEPGPSDVARQFVQAAEELASLATTVDGNESGIKDDQPGPTQQQETSVVVPEGSTIMQMQDGTFLVQRPDGTAMQIHTPEGMSIETVQELLSMEAGQG